MPAALPRIWLAGTIDTWYNHPMDYEIRPVVAAELEAFSEAGYLPFGERVSASAREGARQLLELDRTLAVFDDGAIVATAAAFSFELTVPGLAQVPVAGVTAVGVFPTHRRRGLLARMMRRQLDDVAERGEPLAILTASEGGIYGRFGYGVATQYSVIEIDRAQARMAAPVEVPGRLVLLDRDAPVKVLPPVWDALRRTRVGQLSRSAVYWQETFREGGMLNEGDGTRFVVLNERAPGQADGYAMYRMASGVEVSISEPRRRRLNVEEIVAGDDQVRAVLWQYLLGVDLVTTVRAYVPPDEPLRWRLTDPRQVRAGRLSDHLWARLLDVPAALAARTYGERGRLVFEVRDGFRPQSGGTFELIGGPDGGECRRVDAEPDLRLDTADLGAAYLGGMRFNLLARAGRVAGSPEALRRADRMFGADPLPWSDTSF
jgi:predicted acetyltransferase